MFDLTIIEKGGGGDLILRGADLAVCFGLENTPYLAMFSGAGDWWGSDLTSESGRLSRFASLTEAALLGNPLTSSGRQRIEEAIKADLKTLLPDAPDATATVTTSIPQPGRLDINISIGGQTYAYQWNPDEAFLNYRV